MSAPLLSPSQQPPLFDGRTPMTARVNTLIIGCGNILRGDDAVGPILIRHLWDLGLPEGVRCADGGTGGMDVAFQMRGVPNVILIDACVSGSEPGALFKLPGSAVEHLPPLSGIHMHAFRWDHALAFARWLLKDEYPKNITVYLIEAGQLDFGEPLSPAVAASMRKLADILMASLNPPEPPMSVEFAENGYLHLSAEIAKRYFPNNVLVTQVKGVELWLMPTRGAAAGGLLLKQRNRAGDRSVLIWEALGQHKPMGTRPAFWDAERGALRVALKGGSANHDC